MLYGIEQLDDRQRRNRRWVGAAVLALAVTLVATLHFRRQQGRQDVRAAAFESLAAGDFAAAERSFSRAFGDMQPDPLAVLGLSVLQQMRDRKVRQVPSPPASDELDEALAVHHTNRLLAHALPRQAGEFADQALQVVGKSEQLTRLRWFAGAWEAAIERAR